MPNIDRTYSDTWFTRSESMNNISYADYLKSDEWKSIKRKALLKPFYSSCLKCGSKDGIELHHRNYKWIGTNKAMMGLIPLCRKHHQEVHEYAKAHHISIRLATVAVCKKAYLKMYSQK